MRSKTDLKVGDIIINLFRGSNNFTPGKAYKVIGIGDMNPFPSAKCMGNDGRNWLLVWGGRNEETDDGGNDAHYRLATCNDCAKECKKADVYFICKKFTQGKNCANCQSQCKQNKPCSLFDGIMVVE